MADAKRITVNLTAPADMTPECVGDIVRSALELNAMLVQAVTVLDNGGGSMTANMDVVVAAGTLDSAVQTNVENAINNAALIIAGNLPTDGTLPTVVDTTAEPTPTA